MTAGEKIKLRVDRGVYVFDVKFSEGDRGVVALDSGVGVSVWPKDWKNEAKMEEKKPGLKMAATNGTTIENLGQKVVQFKVIKGVDFVRQPKR